MWTINLCFIDQDKKKIYKLSHTVKPLYTYFDLKEDIDFLTKKIGWSAKNKTIQFKLASYSNVKKIENWNRFILHRDTVHIILSLYNPIFYTLSNIKGDILLFDTSIQKIYSRANTEKGNETLLICQVDENKTKIKIIDIIDNPKVYYNKLVNRMIHNYYEKYKITI